MVTRPLSVSLYDNWDKEARTSLNEGIDERSSPFRAFIKREVTDFFRHSNGRRYRYRAYQAEFWRFCPALADLLILNNECGGN